MEKSHIVDDTLFYDKASSHGKSSERNLFFWTQWKNIYEKIKSESKTKIFHSQNKCQIKMLLMTFAPEKNHADDDFVFCISNNTKLEYEQMSQYNWICK